MALLMRPEPFTEFDRLVTNLLTRGEGGAQRWTPPMDLTETEDSFVLRADLPGMSDEDTTLTVSGERRAEHDERGRGWYRVERSFGRFSRSLTLPEGVDHEGIRASFDKGVLEVRIPKPEVRKPRRVSIQASADEGADGKGRQAVEGTATER